MAHPASDHAPISAKAARGMQDGVVHSSDDATKPSTVHGSSSLQGISQQSSTASTTTSNVSANSSLTPKRNAVPPNTKNASLAHQAAIHRVNARTTGPPSKSLPTTQSTSSSQPVLVRAAPKPANMKNNNNKQKSPSNRSNSPTLPTPENFSFQEILASIGPEADAAIDAIAEICGRSKLSLADEHGSHMPPQGEVEALPIARMETLDESRRNGVQTRAMARRLAMAKNKAGEAPVSSDATAATSSVVSHAPTTGSGAGGRRRRASRSDNGRSSSYAFSLPQILSWLRGSSGDEVDGSTGAAGTLHRLLNEDGQQRSLNT